MNQKQSKIDFFQGGRAQEYLMLVFQDRQRRKRSIFFAFDGLDANAAAFTFLKFDSLRVDSIKKDALWHPFLLVKTKSTFTVSPKYT